MAELKPGIRALIVGCVKRPINVGKECVLQQLLLPGESFIDDTIHDINCNNTPYTVWVVTGPSLIMTVDSIGGEKCIPGVTIVLPKHLMPLDDPDADFEQDVWSHVDLNKRNHFRVFPLALKTWI